MDTDQSRRSAQPLGLPEIEAFVAVARLGSFTAAAKELQFDQSTVTRHVQQLERDLHIDLLARTSRHVELTDEGRQFLPYARRVLDAVRRAGDYAKNLTRP